MKKSQSKFSNIPSYINQSLSDQLNELVNNIDGRESSLVDENRKNLYPMKTKQSFQVLTEKIRLVMTAITTDKLESVWLRAEKHYGKTKDESLWSDIKDGQAWMAWAIYCAIPVEGNQFTKAKADEWRDEVAKHTKALIILLDNPPHTFNHVLTGYKDTMKGVIDHGYQKIIDDAAKSIDPELLHHHLVAKIFCEELLIDPVNHLHKLLEIANNADQKHGLWSSRRGGKAGRRTYFVRSLTNLFIKRTGEAKRGSVQEITNALYDGSISAQQIIELTRDVVDDNNLFEKEPYGTFESVAQRWAAEGY